MHRLMIAGMVGWGSLLLTGATPVLADHAMPAPAAAKHAAANAAHPAPPKLPANVHGKQSVKVYLLTVIGSCRAASHDLQTTAKAYVELAAKHGHDPVAAAKAQPQQTAKLIHQLRDAYERIDSYGYEYVEGIVAGVPSLAKYDVELDSGLPKSMASGSDAVAPVVIHAGKETLDHEGSLNNFLIEPTVFGTNPAFVTGAATLPGFDKPVNLPKPQLVLALANYAVDGYARLDKDARAWQPTDRDCFMAVYSMTPTLADYFQEWKESKEAGGAAGGRFVAVSRVSDMRGIMASTRLIWQSVAAKVEPKDAALTKSISDGYARIMKFIDVIDERDRAHPLNIQTIDALGSQAKQRADQVTAQTAQAAALLGIQVGG